MSATALPPVEQPTLVVETGPRHDEIVVVMNEQIVGRALECSLAIDDPKLSRRHARFLREPYALIVEDLGSRNGTRLNGRAITRAALRDHDLVTIGASDFRVRLPPALQRPAEVRGEQVQLVVPSSREVLPPLARVGPDAYLTAAGVRATEGGALEVQARKFALLYEITRSVQQEADPDAMLAQALDQLLIAVPADRAYIALVNADGELVPRALTRPGSERGSLSEFAVSRTVANYVVRDRCQVITSDVPADARFDTAESLAINRVRSLMAVPILAGDRVHGLIGLESSQRMAGFGASDLDVLSIVASVVGVALHNLQLDAEREATIERLREAQRQLLATQESLVRSEQFAALGRLASGIAHEVKNHLSPFMLADMLAARYADDREVREAAELMLDAQRHILGLVNEIRNLASGAASDPEITARDATALVEGVLRFARCDATVNRHELALESTGPVFAAMDENRIRQVLINLLRNAADAIGARRGHITVHVRGDEARVTIDVRDDGSGMPADVAARVFEPFFTTKGEHGLGLGLDISRKIVEAHGGALTFESTVGDGTTFHVVLPRRDP